MKILIIPDVHARSFYKPVLNIKDTSIIFLGDYMDPYGFEETNDEDGIANLEEIFEFAKKNKNVTLLMGNHDSSFVWSYLGFERTSYKFYSELHRLYRDNINLLHPFYFINDTIFTHAGISKGWIVSMNRCFKYQEKNFELNEKTVLPFIENEFYLELKHDKAPIHHSWYNDLESEIFCIGRSRGGYAPYGGPFWNDFNDDYNNRPFDYYQICGHTLDPYHTGIVRLKDGLACIDSRAIFEYDTDTHIIKPSEINNEETKSKIPEIAWKGYTIRFRESVEESE